MRVAVCGDAIYTVLRIGGEEVHTLNLHPNLLQGPFTIEGRTYRVQGQEVVRRPVEQVVPTVSMVKAFPSDQEDMPVLGYAHQMLPDWIVILDLVEQTR